MDGFFQKQMVQKLPFRNPKLNGDLPFKTRHDQINRSKNIVPNNFKNRNR